MDRRRSRSRSPRGQPRADDDGGTLGEQRCENSCRPGEYEDMITYENPNTAGCCIQNFCFELDSLRRHHATSLTRGQSPKIPHTTRALTGRTLERCLQQPQLAGAPDVERRAWEDTRRQWDLGVAARARPPVGLRSPAGPSRYADLLALDDDSQAVMARWPRWQPPAAAPRADNGCVCFWAAGGRAFIAEDGVVTATPPALAPQSRDQRRRCQTACEGPAAVPELLRALALGVGDAFYITDADPAALQRATVSFALKSNDGREVHFSSHPAARHVGTFEFAYGESSRRGISDVVRLEPGGVAVDPATARASVDLLAVLQAHDFDRVTVQLDVLHGLTPERARRVRALGLHDLSGRATLLGTPLRRTHQTDNYTLFEGRFSEPVRLVGGLSALRGEDRRWWWPFARPRP
jgi:hypothetical protein